MCTNYLYNKIVNVNNEEYYSEDLTFSVSMLVCIQYTRNVLIDSQ